MRRRNISSWLLQIVSTRVNEELRAENRRSVTFRREETARGESAAPASGQGECTRIIKMLSQVIDEAAFLGRSGKRGNWGSLPMGLGQMSCEVDCRHWSTSTKIFQPLRPGQNHAQNHVLRLKQERQPEIKSDLRRLTGVRISPYSPGSRVKGLLVCLNVPCCASRASQLPGCPAAGRGRPC